MKDDYNKKILKQSKLMPRCIWITWENQVRNRSMSSKLGVDLHVLTCNRSRLIRYIVCLWETLLLLMRRWPTIVISQNPSIILTLFLLFMRNIFRFKHVVDAHSSGIESYNNNRYLQMLLDYCNKRSDLVIVTNKGHAEYIKKIGGNPFICEDPFPDIGVSTKGPTRFKDDKNVFFICSYDIDEPYNEVFNAMALLHIEGFQCYASGNYRKVNIIPESFPHVSFLGYVNYAEYCSYLLDSTIVIDLTTKENILLCGAYESMVAEHPLVTSNTDTLKSYFREGTVFTDHSPAAIAEAIRTAYKNRDILAENIRKWKINARSENNNKIYELREWILNRISLIQ